MRDFPRYSLLLAMIVTISFAGNAFAQTGSSLERRENPSVFQGILGSTSQRVQQARQRVAQASYTASNIQANSIRPVDYSVLEETVEPTSPELGDGEILVGENYFETEDCDSCGDSSCSSCATWCFPICLKLRTEDLQIRTGIEGFKNGMNRGMDGSFGALYGFNWGAPIKLCSDNGLSVQFGANGSNANLYKASFTDSTREQLFITAGLFRRVDWGWQGGIVFDYLKEDWYYRTEVTQVRGEISWVNQCNNEFGFWFAASDQADDITGSITLPGASSSTNISETIETESIYALFWRRQLDDCGAEMRLSAGWTENKQGLLGADFHIPITNCLALDSEFAFFLPDSPSGMTRNEAEGWNIGINLVWFPKCGSNVGSKSYNRPLFDVANNGSMFLRRQ
ncbi:MAG: hypothetical protein COA78_20545 [Blastopirellula sp.]|nr:MAG: hypothetical protein COA78_20545 [Blastopirellula sp.]